jgi:hypothetical protein
MSSVEELQRFVEIYREGEYASNAEERVEKWLDMFPPADRLPIATELVHVLRKSFLTLEQATEKIVYWLKNPYIVSRALINSWEEASFLWVQTGGESQNTLHRLMDNASKRLDFPPLSDCRGTSLFVYADDISIHGTRVLNDLAPWIEEQAPKSFELLLLFHIQLVENRKWVMEKLEEHAQIAGKTVRVQWWSDEVFQCKDCYHPSSIPDDEEVVTYLLENYVDPRTRKSKEAGKFFSSDENRCILELALLKAGVRAIAKNPNLRPRKFLRPLGNTIWSGMGFGVPYVTWRNCPNSAPLALWADSGEIALFPRKAN